MISIDVTFFGPAHDAAGVRAARLVLEDGATLSTLTEHLCDQYPGLQAGRGSLRFGVNRELADPDRPLKDGDQVAVIPPVSGGQDREVLVELTAEPIDADRVRATVMGDTALGGVVTFEGATRSEAHADHGPLVHLEYEVYDEMAIDLMRRLVDRVRNRQPGTRIALVHRKGIVKPCEISVMIVVACPHRAEAFEACRWLIDKLKAEVPIWKREVWADGTSTWVEPSKP